MQPPAQREGERAQTAQEEKRAILLGALRKYIRRRRRRPRRSRLPLASLGGLRSGGGGLGSALGTN